jgi:uncharacterized membrane protein
MTTMPPQLRKFALTAHVTSSVGWLGAVAGFLALAIVGVSSDDAQMVRSAYLSMQLIGWFVIVPLAFASPLTGLVQSLGTTWGLFRHYWVLVKLVITVPATLILLLHMQPTGRIAALAAARALAGDELGGLRLQLLADAGAALVALLVTTTLSIYKPRGLTPYGRRRLLEENNGGVGAPAAPNSVADTPRWVRAFWIILVVLVLLFIIRHLTGGSFPHHAP